jgi:hypothetical protein
MTKNAKVLDLYQYGQKTNKNFKNCITGVLETQQGWALTLCKAY